MYYPVLLKYKCLSMNFNRPIHCVTVSVLHHDIVGVYVCACIYVCMCIMGCVCVYVRMSTLKKMAPSMHAAEPLRLPTVTLTPGVIKALLSYTAHMPCQYSRVSA